MNILCFYKRHFLKIKTQVDNKGHKHIYHPNTNPKKAGVTSAILTKVDLNTKSITRVREEHSISDERINSSEYIKIINVYIPNKKFQNT